jgi:hypothetical protein
MEWRFTNLVSDRNFQVVIMASDSDMLLPSSEKSTWQPRSGFTSTPNTWFRQLLWRDMLLILLGFTNILTFGISFGKSTTFNDCVKMTWAYCESKDTCSLQEVETLTINHSTTARPIQGHNGRA